MTPVKFDGYNVNYGAPEGWDPARDGECQVLPVMEFQTIGYRTFSSVWAPSPEERERIAKGENIVLVIVGHQSPVNLSVHPIDGEPAWKE